MAKGSVRKKERNGAAPKDVQELLGTQMSVPP